jgi:two-component sensor histidine kinase
LVGNALKHAFPDGRGRLSVTATVQDGLRILVADDGVGLSRHAAAEDGFGKTLIDMLARQLRASVTWEDAAPGTRAIVTVPLAEHEVRGAACFETAADAASSA